jgi:hypothetical protein
MTAVQYLSATLVTTGGFRLRGRPAASTTVKDDR